MRGIDGQQVVEKGCSRATQSGDQQRWAHRFLENLWHCLASLYQPQALHKVVDDNVSGHIPTEWVQVGILLGRFEKPQQPLAIVWIAKVCQPRLLDSCFTYGVFI
jgi:hypothetical protein